MRTSDFIGAGVLAVYGLWVILITGRARPGRAGYRVLAGRLRGTVWLTLAAAIIIGIAVSPLIGGLMLFAAVGIAVLAVVVAIRGRRNVVGTDE
jgi:heme A synthase